MCEIHYGMCRVNLQVQHDKISLARNTFLSKPWQFMSPTISFESLSLVRFACVRFYALFISSGEKTPESQKRGIGENMQLYVKPSRASLEEKLFLS